MAERFIQSLADNMADVLTTAAVIGGLVLLILYLRARQRRVARLRAEVHGAVAQPPRLREVLGRVANLTTAEMAAVGTVTFVDIAWQYSLADPQIWDHFSGPAADHIIDAIQNLDVLRASLGERSQAAANQLLESLKATEAAQVFHDLVEKLPLVESAAASTAVAVEASGHSMVDSLSAASAAVEGKAHAAAGAVGATAGGGLIQHLPLVTIGFATYRAWRRSQRGTGLGRNIEFTAIEVATRAGGGLIGSQLGGAAGTAIAPGIGTLLGGVAGAVAGTIGGVLLGEDIKKRHLRQAQRAFEESLEQLGRTYLEEPAAFQRLTGVFVQHERAYVESLRQTRRRLLAYAMPWRIAWPDQKLILLQETVRLAEDRLSSVRQGTIDAIDRLDYMRVRGQNRELGAILWSNPALRDQVDPDPALVQTLDQQQARLRREIAHMGLSLSESAAM